MKNEMSLLNRWYVSLCLLSLVCLGLYLGLVFEQKHANSRFLSKYDGVVVGHNLVEVFKQLRTKPIYDLELTRDNLEFVRACGLKSFPIYDNYSELRVAVFPCGGIPHRFIFVFYSPKGSNVVAKAHDKM